ncbi:substrate-binding periplasmic protein [Sneathiella limimaris]|uniref:substrate-binding periplasmic protein n=1 Tax=Sneathiella limimaris TaxID=1964213 RepID=UPI00146E3A65|nr:transporter substrate-binding domain-containing protein [Sneathiella limimaris]
MPSGIFNVDPRDLNKVLARLLFVIGVVALGWLSPALASEPLKISIAAGSPFHKSGQTGFVDLVLKEAFERIGVEVDVVKYPAERAIHGANNGDFDGDGYRVAGLERIYPNLIRVPEKIFDMRFGAFSRDETVPTEDWDSLTPYSIGLIIGWKIFELNVKSERVTKVKNVDQLFSLLSKGRVEVALYDQWQGLAYLQENQISGFKVLDPLLATKDMYLYLHKKHADKVPLVANALREMKADGTLQKYIDQIMSPLLM